MDPFWLNLISVVLILLALFIPSYFKWRIRPVALVENDFDFIDRQLNTMNAHQRQIQPININLRPIQIPFVVDFNLLKSTSRDGIYFKIKQFSNEQIKNNLNLIVLWFVDIEKFYSKLDGSVRDIFYGENSEYFKDVCQKHYQNKINFIENERELNLEIPSECSESFKQIESNNTQRDVFHLAIIVFKDKTDLESLSNDSVVANVNIYHLKDSKMETRLLHNYVKCINNRTISLTGIKTLEDDLCVACQVNPSDQLLLPCTHKCVCSECLVRISDNKCPMCRTQIRNRCQITN